MTLPRATVMVLVPGRQTLTFELDHRVPSALLAVLMCSALIGATVQRCFNPGFGEQRCVKASDLTGSLHSLPWPEPARGHSFVAVRTLSPQSRSMNARPLRVKSASLSPAPVAPPAPLRATPPLDPSVSSAGMLRVTALHLGESLNIQAFDASGAPEPTAFAALQHLMRCRVSGEEVPIDPRLVRILAQVSAVYDRPIQLVSGHRKPHVIGTKPTSQHAHGTAADIRVAGVGIHELRALVMKLGARGVGLYPEKGFIHVDVREKRYFWTFTQADGEQADLGLLGARAAIDRHAVGE